MHEKMEFLLGRANLASPAADGFMAAADKDKLDTLPATTDPTGTTATAVATHVGESDPHAQYLLTAEADTLFLTPAEGDAAYAGLAHATRHKSGGADAIKLDELAAPTDITTLNATVALHGLCPKLGGGTTNFLRADGAWAAPPAGGSGNNGTATIDFGPTPNDSASIAVTGQTDITSAAHVRAWFQRDATAPGGNSADEHEMAAVFCPLVVGNIIDADGFTVYGNSIGPLASGAFTLHWNWA